MFVDSIYITNTTQMSLSDRFTILQSARAPSAENRSATNAYALNYVPDRSRKNRIMNRMGRNPPIQAEVPYRIPLNQRLGKVGRRSNTWSLIQQNAVRALSPGRMWHGGRLLPKGQEIINYTSLRKPRSISKSNSVDDLNRWNSWDNLSEEQNWNHNQNNGYVPRGRRFRGRGSFRGFRGGQDRGAEKGKKWNGRGRGRGRGRGWNRSSNYNKSPPPSKEQLDQELDQYMAASKGYLDRQLDNYMSTPMDIF